MNFSIINSPLSKQLFLTLFISSFFFLSPLRAQHKQKTLDSYPVCTNLAEVQQNIGYPKAAAKEGIEGKVMVKVKVNKEGKVVESEILEGSPKALAESVEPHLNSLNFTPGKKEGKTVSTWVTLPFLFKLSK